MISPEGCLSLKKFGYCSGFHETFINLKNKQCTNSDLDYYKNAIEKNFKPWQIEAWKKNWENNCPKLSIKEECEINNPFKINILRNTDNEESIIRADSQESITEIENNLQDHDPCSITLNSEEENEENNAFEIIKMENENFILAENDSPEIFNDEKIHLPEFIATKDDITLNNEIPCLRHLRSWKIHLSNSSQPYIMGFLEDIQVMWCERIIEVLDSFKLKTFNNVIVILVGPLVDSNNSLPEYIKNKFSYGFQKDWLDYIKLWKIYQEKGKPKNFNWDIKSSILKNEFYPPKINSKKVSFSSASLNKEYSLTPELSSSSISSIGSQKPPEKNLFAINNWCPSFDFNQKKIYILGTFNCNNQGKIELNKPIIKMVTNMHFQSSDENIYFLEGPPNDPLKTVPKEIINLIKKNFLLNFKKIINIWSNLQNNDDGSNEILDVEKTKSKISNLRKRPAFETPIIKKEAKTKTCVITRKSETEIETLKDKKTKLWNLRRKSESQIERINSSQILTSKNQPNRVQSILSNVKIENFDTPKGLKRSNRCHPKNRVKIYKVDLTQDFSPEV